ncbi:hypothetical protein CBR_g2891 [Chara braunii]|uniref:Right handed beta helix domain-containing protein n=1 Tax=Chara braunii TaxID=69332 RepID=A0A388KEB4_CHABU|nr:hypothetical protein CBR_g2891 [Chara braunii]|eukprot:GBG68347.1 hypothetical protein CBR_g2891 [Chara braunii]
MAAQTASALSIANEQQLAAAINGIAGVTVTITSDIVLTKEFLTAQRCWYAGLHWQVQLEVERRRGRLEKTTFKSNRAEGDGGAVYINGQPANTVGYVLDHVTFDSNTAGNAGGGMYVAGTSQAVVKVFVSRCKFTKNVATGGEGGALALSVLMDARICHTSIADGGNKANGGQGNNLALLDGNYNPQMTVSFCPAHLKSLSLHVTAVANPPTVRHHCEVCELPK